MTPAELEALHGIARQLEAARLVLDGLAAQVEAVLQSQTPDLPGPDFLQGPATPSEPGRAEPAGPIFYQQEAAPVRMEGKPDIAPATESEERDHGKRERQGRRRQTG